jgi:hypothetical protein
MYVLFCIFCFHYANWDSSAILTEIFPCFFLSCKANARVYLKDAARPALFAIRLLIVLFLLLIVLFYILFVCKCVQCCCHLVTTQLQLTNISYHNYGRTSHLPFLHQSTHMTDDLLILIVLCKCVLNIAVF